MSDSEIKLSCRGVWKLFGTGAEALLKDRSAPPSLDEIHKAGLIGAVRDADLDVRQGEIFVIMGLSGSGKSTLVRCLSRLIEPTAGQILFEGQDLLRASDRDMIEIRRHRMGMVFQHFALLPHLTVLGNVAFPLEVQGIDRKTREERARRVIELVRPRRSRILLPARIVRRPAAARRYCPLARRGAGTVVPRRAVLRARSADPARDAGRVHPPAERLEEDDRLHHARLRRGDPSRRPYRHHEGRRDHPDRHAGRAGPGAGDRLRGRVHPPHPARQGDDGGFRDDPVARGHRYGGERQGGRPDRRHRRRGGSQPTDPSR